MIKTIVVPTDGSAHAKLAIELAADIAQKLRYSRKLVMAPEGRHIMAVLRRRQFSKRKGMPHVQI